MTKVRNPLSLEWFGPINFLTGMGVPYPEDHDRMIKLAKPGVYLWVYPKEHFGKTGIYVGKSKNLIRRHFEHLGWWLNGHYRIIERPSYKFSDVSEFGKEGFEDHVIKSWQEARACEFYFAPTNSDDEAKYAERTFIEAFQDVVRKAEKDKPDEQKKYFYDQDLRQTWASPNELVFKNSGAEFVIKIFGDKVKWIPKQTPQIIRNSR
ncbi:MAG: hypothetical protein IIA70_08100 [Proteobacteria bacterium]|nr:hypothetical protein [Pseudomonadota bacterium]